MGRHRRVEVPRRRKFESARERFQLQRYLGSTEKVDAESQASTDSSAVQAALEKLRQNPEPDAGFMLMRGSTLPAYNFQSAVDAEHALIVAHDVVLDAADNRCLQPMAEAAKAALEVESLHVVADAGYSNGEQAANCEAAGIVPHAPHCPHSKYQKWRLAVYQQQLPIPS